MSIAPTIPPLPFEDANLGDSPRLWTVKEYHRASELGLFQPFERLELIRGEIIRKMPQKPSHSTALRLIMKILERMLGQSFEIRPQLPITVSEYSEPEPDIVVAVGKTEDYAHHHPA